VNDSLKRRSLSSCRASVSFRNGLAAQSGGESRSSCLCL
jgi:hypothetical protein